MTTDAVSTERGGATSVQLALLWVGTLALVLAGVQVAIYGYATQLALSAAEDGLRSGRYHRVESTTQAEADAAAFLTRTAGSTLTGTSVTAAFGADGTLQVTVSGDVLSVVPGTVLRVTRQATGAIERPTP
jgi:hypothetical protein